MQKSVLFRVIVCWASVTAFSNVWSRDMGTIGKSWEIIEEDMIVLMQNKTQALVDSGEVDRKHKEMRDSTKKYLYQPPGVTLPVAEKYRMHEYDPTFVLDHDVRDEKGNLIYPVGTMVNPLNYINMNRALCFIDGNDEKQVKWLLDFCGDPLEAKMILVNGPLGKLMENHPDKPFYFDQRAVLVDRLKIKAVPSVVRQSGKMLVVEEFAIEN